MKNCIIALLAMASPAMAIDVPEDFDIGIATDIESMFTLSIIKVDEGDSTKDIFFYAGAINTHTTETIEYFSKKHPEIKEISLHSNGGDAYESFELGFFFSDAEFQTTVSPGRICLSSCAFAFLGGQDYKVDGILGFHSGWLPSVEISFMTPEMINQVYSRGQALGSALSYYSLINGFNPAWPTLLPYITDKDNFWVFTHEDQLDPIFSRNVNENGLDDINNYFKEFPEDLLNDDSIWSSKEMTEFVETYEGSARGRPVLSVYHLFPFEIQDVDALDPRQ